MTPEEKLKLNRLYNRVVNNCGVFIMTDKWYDETSYGKACLEFNSRLNELREIEEYFYNPYNIPYYGVLGKGSDKVNRYINKLRFTNNWLIGKTIIMSGRPETKKDRLEEIKKRLPLTEAEFDNIRENTFLYYLNMLDDKYKFTRFEKMYLMEYCIMIGDKDVKNDE